MIAYWRAITTSSLQATLLKRSYWNTYIINNIQFLVNVQIITMCLSIETVAWFCYENIPNMAFIHTGWLLISIGAYRVILFIQGDYHNIEHSDNYFDKAYALEATCHSADLIKVYSEIYRVLKPGGLFVCCEWIMTEEYDSTNAYHRKLKDDILVSCKYFTKNWRTTAL